jgi:hypothetical protein
LSIVENNPISDSTTSKVNPMGVDADQSRLTVTISTITHDCRRRLRECAYNEQHTGTHWAQNRLSDFNLWDAGVGASAKQHHSLETRLREDNTATKVVVSTLSTLRAWLDIYQDRVNEPREYPSVQSASTLLESPVKGDDEDISKDEAKDSIEQLLQVLIKLGVAIRQAGSASHLRNADSEFHKRRGEYQDFETEMMSILIWKRTQCMLAGDLQLSEVQKKYDEIQKEVKKETQENRLPYETQAIVQANARRRHRFAFAAKRANKLKEKKLSAMEEKDISLKPASVPTLDSTTHSVTIHQKRISQRNKSDDKSVRQSAHLSSVLPSSTTKLSTHKPDGRISKAIEDDRPLAPPTVTTSKVNYPSVPTLEDDATVFTCPYCWVTLSKATAKGSRWV